MIADDDTRSRSATDCLLYLQGENLPPDELAYWQYLAVKAQRYPLKYIPPFKKAKGSARVRRLVGCRIGTRNDARGQAVPRLLQLYDGSLDVTVDVSECDDGANAFAHNVFTTANRSAFIIFAEGGRIELRLIAQRWGQRLMALGYTIDVLMGGGKLKCLIVKKDRHRWYLTDWEATTGMSPAEVISFARRTAQHGAAKTMSASTVWAAAARVQSLLVQWFGVGLSLTISSSGLHAACRYLSEEVCKFKPAPMLVAMCRDGGGFRGGLVYGRRYRGPAWLVDINRAYTAALKAELPWRAFLGKCDTGHGERRGLWMCRVVGNASVSPIFVGRWDGRSVDVSWHQDRQGLGFLCILTTSEIAGIRAIGYDVTPGWGMVYARTFTLAAFVDRIVSLCLAYRSSSIEARFTKLLGNSVYGKFAASPTRRDIRLSNVRPGRDWLVFVDDTGYPVDDLWEREKTTYQWSQHIDIATDITARVRGQIYEAQAATHAAGGQVVALSTDAMVVDIEPGELLAIHASEFGRFKLAGVDADGIVAGPNAYAIGEKVIVPDYPNPLRQDVIALFSTFSLDVETQRNGAPWPGAPLSWKVRKRVTVPSTAPHTTTDWQTASRSAYATAPPDTASSSGSSSRLRKSMALAP